MLPLLPGFYPESTQSTQSSWKPAGGGSNAVTLKRAQNLRQKSFEYAEQVRSKLTAISGGLANESRSPSPSGRSPRSPRARSPGVRAQDWCHRHHLVSSRGNVRFPRNQRTYFDVLPQVHVSYGKYVEVPLHRPLDDNALGVEKLWEWRAERYPQFNPSDTKIGMSTTMSSTYDPGGSAMTTARDGQKWVDKSKGILEASAVMLFDLQAAGEVATKIKEASEIKSPKPKAHRLRASINHASTTPFGENKNTHTSHIASQKKLLASARAKALKRTALASLASQEPLARFLDWAESKKLNSMQV